MVRTSEEAKYYDQGTALDDDLILRSPKWTWILQTILLAIALVCIALLFMILLFNSKPNRDILTYVNTTEYEIRKHIYKNDLKQNPSFAGGVFVLTGRDFHATLL